MSRLLSSEVSDGTEIPDDEQGIFQILFEIHLEIGSSVLRWKARLPATRGRQPGTKQASGTDTTRGLCPQGFLRPTGQPCSLLGASWQYFPEGSSFQSSDHERLLSLTKIGLKAWGRSTKRCYRLENSEAKIYNPMLSSFLALEVMVSFWGNQGDNFVVLLTTIRSWIYGKDVFSSGFVSLGYTALWKALCIWFWEGFLSCMIFTFEMCF